MQRLLQVNVSLDTNSSQHVQAERHLHYRRGPYCTAILHLCVENLDDTNIHKSFWFLWFLPFRFKDIATTMSKEGSLEKIYEETEKTVCKLKTIGHPACLWGSSVVD